MRHLSEGEKDVFKLERVRDWKMRDLGYVKCIKGDDNKVSVEESQIREK